MNLELISLVFKTKVALYQLTEDSYLIATVVNYKFENTIEFLRCEEGHFDCLFNKRFLQNAEICRGLIQNVFFLILNAFDHYSRRC